MKILQPKTGKFSDKKFWFFHISAQIIDCGYSIEPPRRGDSNEYPQSMYGYSIEPPRRGDSNEYPQSIFWAEISKIMYTPVNPSSGPWAWWAKLAYQVMLTIRGRLITPFVLGSMSVGLNILIRHSFMDLWFWITALVPWPQLLFTTRLVSLPGGRSVRPRGHRQPSIINMVAHINSDKIVAGTSPIIKRSRLTQVSSATSQPVHTIPAGSKGTGSAAQTGAPRILLKDVHKMTYL